MTIQKKLLLLTTVLCSCFLVACEAPKKEEAKKASTIEEIHREKGKPAKVSPVSKQTLADYRIFSGAISGKQQASAIAKMADPIKEIKVSIGSTVKKDQVLAEYLFTGDNTGKEQAEEQVKLLEASVKRLQEVYTKGGISKQDLEQAETQLRIAKMGLETARRASVILSPSNGVVTSIDIEQGQVPKLGAAIFTIAQLNEVILTIPVSTKDIGAFKKGLKAYVDINDKTIEGKVTKVPMAANEMTRFFPVEITFNNKGRQLLPGMFVTAKINAKNIEAIAVPNEAIVYQNGNNYVWRVVDGKANRKLVTLGVADASYTQIQSGIELSDIIMTEGMSKMNEGDKVLIVDQN